MRDTVLFTYDDHQAGTAFQDVPGQPNRIRCVRDARWKYAIYLDPTGGAAPEYELYDLEDDPDEALNLVDKRTGRGRTRAAERERVRMHERLRRGVRANGHDLAGAAAVVTVVGGVALDGQNAVLPVQRVVVDHLELAARDPAEPARALRRSVAVPRKWMPPFRRS